MNEEDEISVAQTIRVLTHLYSANGKFKCEVIRTLQHQGMDSDMLHSKFLQDNRGYPLSAMPKKLRATQHKFGIERMQEAGLLTEDLQLTEEGERYGVIVEGKMYWAPETVEYVRFHS